MRLRARSVVCRGLLLQRPRSFRHWDRSALDDQLQKGRGNRDILPREVASSFRVDDGGGIRD